MADGGLYFIKPWDSGYMLSGHGIQQGLCRDLGRRLMQTVTDMGGEVDCLTSLVSPATQLWTIYQSVPGEEKIKHHEKTTSILT